MQIDALNCFLCVVIVGVASYGIGHFRGYGAGVRDAIDELRPTPTEESP